MSTSESINIREGRVTLRGVELADIDLMYGIENDLENWGVSGTTQPYSRYLIESFIESQRGDIYSTRQLRLMICNDSSQTIGTVDIFEFEPQHHRAGVGIFILEGYRAQGYGVEALRALERYCFGTLQLHQLWCGVAADNEASRRLFARAGYKESGRRREWLYREGRYCDEIFMQRVELD